MEIYCCQTDIAWEDRGENFARMDDLLQGVEVAPGSLLVFPELCTAGFSMNVEEIAEPVAGPTAAYFSNLARRLSSHVIAGIPGRDTSSGLGRNEAVCFSPQGTEKARYRKNRLFPLVDEGRHYEAGLSGVIVDCAGWKVAPLICYDLRFPELFRSSARSGVDVFVVIANWPMAREEHWITLLRARAIENQAYVVGVNRCGSDPVFQYSGASLMVAPTGEILARAGTEPVVLRAELDRRVIDEWRSQFPALADLVMD